MKDKSLKINAFLNALKQGTTVIFPLIIIPYISRVLGNENYGKINFGSSITNYISIIAMLGVSTYAVVEGSKQKHDKEHLCKFMNEVFTINMISTGLAYLFLGFVLVFCKQVYFYRSLIIIQSLPILFTTLGTDWENNIFEDFKYTTIRYICVQITALILIFLFVKDRSDFLIYVLIQSFANVLSNIINIIYIRNNYIKIKLTKKICLKKHYKPILLLFANSLAVTIYVSSDITILTLFHGDIVTGVYSIGVKIYTIIKQLLNAVISVVIPRLSRYIGEANELGYKILIKKLMLIIFQIGLPSMVGLFILSKEILSIVAGFEYQTGFVSLSILSVALIISLFTSVYVYGILIPNGYQKQTLLATIIAAGFNILFNLILIPKFSLNAAAFTTMLSELIVLILGIYYSRNLNLFLIQFKETLPTLIGALLVAAICIFSKNYFINVYQVVFFSIFCSIFIYLIILLMFRDEGICRILSLIKKK